MRKPTFCICEIKGSGARLISAFVFPTKYNPSTSLIQKLKPLLPFSAAVQLGLCLTWSETPNTGFLMTMLIVILSVKTNKSPVDPVRTRTSLCMCPLWSVFTVSLKISKILSDPLSSRVYWSDWMDSQADLSSLGAQLILFSFCHMS